MSILLEQQLRDEGVARAHAAHAAAIAEGKSPDQALHVLRRLKLEALCGYVERWGSQRTIAGESEAIDGAR